MWKRVFSSLIPLRYVCVLFYTHTRSKTIKCAKYAVALWKSWVCKYSIRFQVIKLKPLCETLKNEKLLLDNQTKCGDIANETQRNASGLSVLLFTAIFVKWISKRQPKKTIIYKCCRFQCKRIQHVDCRETV